jgi:predicted PurR-regulated permease PerM
LPVADKSRRPTVIFLIVLLSLAAGAALVIFWPFLRPVFFAAILAVGLYPLHRWVLRHLRNDSAAATLSTLGVLLLFVVPLGFTVTAVSAQMAQVGSLLAQRSRQEGGAQQFATKLAQPPMEWAERHHIDLQRLGVRSWVESLPLKASSYFIAAGSVLLAGLAGFAGQTVITFFVLFFLFRDGPEILRRMAALLPLSEAQFNRLNSSIQNSVVANLYGILAVAVVQGGLTGIALLALGVRSALMLGVLAGLASLVPLVGTTLVWVPAAVYLFVTAPLWKGIALILWGSLVVGTSDNIVRPLVVRGRDEIHPLIVMFAILGGLSVFGFLGIFLGPMTVSLLVALTELLRDELRGHHVDPATPTAA